MTSSIAAIGLLATLLALPALAALAHDSHAAAHDQHHTHAQFDPATARQTEFGIAGDPKQVTRVIALRMGDDMRFTPADLTIKQGETVRLALSNKGKMLHEIVLGSAAGLQEHAAMMRQHPGMAHSAPNMLHVPPGKHGEVVWRFNQAGQFEFACLIPGHYEAGMKGTITVVAATGQAAK